MRTKIGLFVVVLVTCFNITPSDQEVISQGGVGIKFDNKSESTLHSDLTFQEDYQKSIQYQFLTFQRELLDSSVTEIRADRI